MLVSEAHSILGTVLDLSDKHTAFDMLEVHFER